MVGRSSSPSSPEGPLQGGVGALAYAAGKSAGADAVSTRRSTPFCFFNIDPTVIEPLVLRTDAQAFRRPLRRRNDDREGAHYRLHRRILKDRSAAYASRWRSAMGALARASPRVRQAHRQKVSQPATSPNNTSDGTPAGFDTTETVRCEQTGRCSGAQAGDSIGLVPSPALRRNRADCGAILAAALMRVEARLRAQQGQKGRPRRHVGPGGRRAQAVVSVRCERFRRAAPRGRASNVELRNADPAARWRISAPLARGCHRR